MKCRRSSKFKKKNEIPSSERRLTVAFLITFFWNLSHILVTYWSNTNNIVSLFREKEVFFWFFFLFFFLKEVSEISAADTYREVVYSRALMFSYTFWKEMYSCGNTVIIPFPLNLITLSLAQSFSVSNNLPTLFLFLVFLLIFYSFVDCLGISKHFQKSLSPCSITSLS